MGVERHHRSGSCPCWFDLPGSGGSLAQMGTGARLSLNVSRADRGYLITDANQPVARLSPARTSLRCCRWAACFPESVVRSWASYISRAHWIASLIWRTIAGSNRPLLSISSWFSTELIPWTLAKDCNLSQGTRGILTSYLLPRFSWVSGTATDSALGAFGSSRETMTAGRSLPPSPDQSCKPHQPSASSSSFQILFRRSLLKSISSS